MKPGDAPCRPGRGGRAEGVWRLPLGTFKRTVFAGLLVAGMAVAGPGGAGTLAVAAALPVTSCQVSWANPAGGSWAVPRNWSTGRVPTASQSVCISVPTNNPVTMTLTTGAARSLTIGTSAAADMLVLNGSRLGLSGPLTVAGAGTLVLHGGTVDLGAKGASTNDGVIVGEASANLNVPSGSQLDNAGQLLCASGTTVLDGNVVNEKSGTIAAVGASVGPV